jgi:hypothetical protein
MHCSHLQNHATPIKFCEIYNHCFCVDGSHQSVQRIDQVNASYQEYFKCRKSVCWTNIHFSGLSVYFLTNQKAAPKKFGAAFFLHSWSAYLPAGFSAVVLGVSSWKN